MYGQNMSSSNLIFILYTYLEDTVEYTKHHSITIYTLAVSHDVLQL
jgi:hypothetical protein